MENFIAREYNYGNSKYAELLHIIIEGLEKFYRQFGLKCYNVRIGFYARIKKETDEK